MTLEQLIADTPTPRTRESLARDLRQLGVEPGMTLLVHSSLRALGWVAGGPIAVVQALMDVLTPQGTLVMPTHSGSYSDPAPWENPPVPRAFWPVIREHWPAFDPQITPTEGMGRIPETFRTFPGVRRSDHPTVSFAAWGRHAEQITTAHALSDSLGEGSPLARIYDLDGHVLLLGVGYDRNTSFHLAEYRLPDPWVIECGSPIMEGSQRVWLTYHDIDFDDRPFETIGAGLEAAGHVREGRVGSAPARLFGQRPAVDHALRWLTTARQEEIDALVERLSDADEAAQFEAADALCRLGRSALPRALGLAEDSRPHLRAMACHILGGLVDRSVPGKDGLCVAYHSEGVPALVRLLRTDPDAPVRSAAALALGTQRAPATLPALIGAADDAGGTVRYGVARALSDFHSWCWEEEAAQRYRDAARGALLRLMDDLEDDVRDWATFALQMGQHDTPETRARLWQALEDPNPDVRGEAADALAIFGDRSLVPRLERLLREDPDLSPCFFSAAEELGDPRLLPAVEDGAARWRESLQEGETLHAYITSAIEALRKGENPPET